ncbi:HEAT repeat domain-containing protein [Microcoleus sp.]|uniref:HEAT repeat domain-containing protein n=1 Tax=Microcoleus sp. TaxID=44472 RepID=UPI00403E99F1
MRRRAVSGLGAIGDAQAIPGLLKLVEHSDSDVRRVAVDALGNIGESGVWGKAGVGFVEGISEDVN